MYVTPCIQRIWEYNKALKIIAILRNPIERAFSEWNMEVTRGNERENFTYCIEKETERCFDVLPNQHKIYSYVDRGFYSEQIRRIYRFFPKHQVLFIKYDDYLKSQYQVLLKIFDFLGVDADNYFFTPVCHNKLPYKREMTLQEREMLSNIYVNDIMEVERLLKWNCSDWN